MCGNGNTFIQVGMTTYDSRKLWQELGHWRAFPRFRARMSPELLGGYAVGSICDRFCSCLSNSNLQTLKIYYPAISLHVTTRRLKMFLGRYTFFFFSKVSFLAWSLPLEYSIANFLNSQSSLWSSTVKKLALLYILSFEEASNLQASRKDMAISRTEVSNEPSMMTASWRH